LAILIIAARMGSRQNAAHLLETSLATPLLRGFKMKTKHVTHKPLLPGTALMKAAAALTLFVGAASNSWAQKSEGLAATPQMGWNSWNKFACEIDERLIRETADAMVKTGMKDAGYQYVNIDDCWQGQRDADGNIQPDA
jgi:alpha-galactosidase